MLKISRTSENKHHKVYIFRILRKNANKKIFLKIPGITIVAPLKPKKIKMVAEAVEKMQKNPETVKKMEKRKKKKKWEKAKKTSCYTFCLPTDSNIFAHKHFILK